MTLQVVKPYIHVEDANGNPYVGAKLYVYVPGTTTPAAIYADAALSIPLPNPLSGETGSDAAGNFPRAYIAAGAYKLRAETAAGVLIWQEDNIDTGLSAGSGALPIASGGTGGITAAAARTNLDVPSNSELAALATDITDIQTSLQNIVSVPQGYLTATSLTPIITAGVSAGTAVYYTPFLGNIVPIYDGTQFNATRFSELPLTLNSNHLLGTIYDCYVVSDSGTLRLVTGPAWNTSTAGAGARGTGAGTAEITRTNGLWTNANAMTARNGANTYSVAINRGLYVGSILIDGAAGQITCHRDWGQSRKFAVWNAYNRKAIPLIAGDSTASWSYGTATWRASNGASGNSISAFVGLAEEMVNVQFKQLIQTGGTSVAQVGIGVNSTISPSNFLGYTTQTGLTSNSFSTQVNAEYAAILPLGLTTFTSLEKVSTAGSVFVGTQQFMTLSAAYQG